MHLRWLALAGPLLACRPAAPSVPPAATPAAPTVELATDIADPCADIEAQRAAFDAEHAHDDNSGPGGDDHAYPPRCENIELGATTGLDPVWAHGVAWCAIHDEIYGPNVCQIQFRRGAETAGFSRELASTQERIKVLALTARPGIAEGAPALVVQLEAPDGEHVMICRAEPRLACTAPVQISAEDWKTAFRFDAGRLVLDAIRGIPPPGVEGRHRLVFP